jgi:hypothetical protein
MRAFKIRKDSGQERITGSLNRTRGYYLKRYSILNVKNAIKSIRNAVTGISYTLLVQLAEMYVCCLETEFSFNPYL